VPQIVEPDIPVDRHLLVNEFASDAGGLLFEAETYERFRTERRAEIWRHLLAAMGASASVQASAGTRLAQAARRRLSSPSRNVQMRFLRSMTSEV
jgi:hypothetical protein